jgi:DNA-binding winged helix-turn-helix (wHTH) protein
VRIRLQQQPFHILSLLLEHPGELFTRDELRQELWPADTFVDFDRSLNKAMNKLRAALCDSAASPRFIETVHRRGYRFLAPVIRQDKDRTPGRGASHLRGHNEAGMPAIDASLSWAARALCDNVVKLLRSVAAFPGRLTGLPWF